MNPEGDDQKADRRPRRQVIDYEWSPDSKWLVLRPDGWLVRQRAVHRPATGDGGEPARNVTRYATDNVGVTWSQDGKKLAFLGERRGSTSGCT